MSVSGAIEPIRRFLRGRPALPAAAAFVLGIAVYDTLPIAPWVWLSLLVGVIGAICRLRHRLVLLALMLPMGCAFAGVLLAQIDAFYYPLSHIGAFATDTPRLAQLELHIDDPPRILTAPFGSFRAMPPKQVLGVSVRQIKTWDGWRRCVGQMLVQVSQPNPQLMQGQTIRVMGMLQRPAPANNPGQFDWASYYRQQRVLASLQIGHANQIQVVESEPIGWLNQCRQAVREALAQGFWANAQLDFALLRALTLGDNDPELRDVQEQFRRTGTSHHLAISGMHVAVLGGMVYWLCRLIRVRPRAASVLALIAVIFYGLVALPSPPVLRAVIVSVAVVIASLSRRRIDGVQTWSLAVIFVLALHPMDLFNAGFLLSFGVVLGLLLLTKPMLEWFATPDIDVEIARSMQRLGRVSVMIAWIKQTIRLTLAAAIIAWLVSLPIVAFAFEQMNPWAIFASIVLAPIVVLALIGGVAKIILTLLWPTLAGTWAVAAIGPTTWMRWMVGALAKLPGSDVPLPTPAWWVIVLYYIALIAFIVPRYRWVWLNRLSRTAALLICLTLLFWPLRSEASRLRSDAQDLKITLLAVGAGQTCVVEPPDAPAALVDAGSSSVNDVMRQVLGPFLRHAGRRQIGEIFVTHGDYDHLSAVADAVEAYDVPSVYIAPQFRDGLSGRPAAEGLLRNLDADDKPAKLISLGGSIDLGGGVRADVLWPPVDAKLGENDASLVMQITFAGHRVLVTGDIENAAEKALSAEPDAVHADVMIAPHHGSFESTTEAFVAAVHPRFIVSSNDRTPSGKQKAFDRAMKDYPVFHTDKCGAITVRFTPEGVVTVEPFLKR